MAISSLMTGTPVDGRTIDGMVEAVEMPHHPFALAVQWHPECLSDAPEQRALFEAFVEAAKGSTN